MKPMAEMTDAEILALVRPLLKINYHVIHARENQAAISGIEYFIEHPMIERLQGTLLECPVHDKIRDNPVLHEPGVFWARPNNLYADANWEVRKA